VDRIIADNLFESHLLSTKHIFFEDLYVYQIKKTQLLKELDKKLVDISLLAKGCRGYVYQARYRGRKVAVKLKNPDSAAPARMQ
jgi:hypothetical protein